MLGTVSLIICFGAGAALGVVYFTGLWVTVKHLPDARRPFAALLGSFLARILLLMTGFTLLMNGRGEFISAALLGFLLAREILVRRLGLNR
jgi:F1F0 ATPase subunit 2